MNGNITLMTDDPRLHGDIKQVLWTELPGWVGCVLPFGSVAAEDVYDFHRDLINQLRASHPSKNLAILIEDSVIDYGMVGGVLLLEECAADYSVPDGRSYIVICDGLYSAELQEGWETCGLAHVDVYCNNTAVGMLSCVDFMTRMGPELLTK